MLPLRKPEPQALALDVDLVKFRYRQKKGVGEGGIHQGTVRLNSTTLASLRFFEAAARLFSVRRAAERVRVAQGAVSCQIKYLEKSLSRTCISTIGPSRTEQAAHFGDVIARPEGRSPSQCPHPFDRGSAFDSTRDPIRREIAGRAALRVNSGPLAGSTAWPCVA